MDPCAGRIPRRCGSIGSPAENVRVKIPVIAQTMPEITNAAVVISAGLEIRAISMKMAATAKRRIAVVEYLFRIIGFIFSTSTHGYSLFPSVIIIAIQYYNTHEYASKGYSLIVSLGNLYLS
jgi:hypothetical protein